MMVLGQFSVRDIIDDDLSILLLPCSPLLDRRNDDVEHPNDPRCALAQQMEQFRQRVAGSYLDLLRSLCQNRCRLRRILCHSIKEWEMLYLELDSIDGLLQLQLDEEPLPPTAIPGFLAEDGLQYSMPLQSWAYSYKLRLMEWVVQLGFELELYLPDELASMYWWLSYLAQCRFRFTSKNRAMISHSRDETRAAQQGQVHHTVEAQYTRALSHNRLSTLDACLVRDLAEAVSLVFVVLARLQLVRAPARPYGGDDLRYAVRMRPWTTVGLPEVPAAAELAALTDRPAVATPDLLRRAEQALAGARETLEALGRMGEREAFHAAGGYARWRAGVLDCQRSAIAAGLAVSMLRKHADDAGALRVEMPRPEGRYHEWWIVPKVTEKKAEETEA